MEIKTKLLPDFCYNKNFAFSEDRKINLIVLHYFSAKNTTKPDDKYDMDTCRDLFIELNSYGKDQGKLLKDSDVLPDDKRGYGSAHLLIGREKNDLWQLVPYDKKAYHAGTSEWNDRTNCNNFSIGIELVGEYDKDYTEHQYINIADSIIKIQKLPYVDIDIKRNLNTSGLMGHEHIAPGRKNDPGPTFHWKVLWDILGVYDE